MSIPQCRRGHNSTRNASGACRQCAQENKEKHLKAHPGYHKTWYKTSRTPERRKKNVEQTSKRYRETSQQLQTIKANNGCSICPERDVRCLDFHHVNPLEKSFTISDGLTFSKSRLQTELDKCIVVCANCHRKLTNPN